MNKVICCRCGGYGGEPANNIEPGCDPLAWHPCYHCGTTGRCGCPDCLRCEEAAVQEGLITSNEQENYHERRSS